MTARVLPFLPKPDAIDAGRDARRARGIVRRYHVLAHQLFNGAPASGIGRVVAVRRAYAAWRTALDALDAVASVEWAEGSDRQIELMIVEGWRSDLYPLYQRMARETFCLVASTFERTAAPEDMRAVQPNNTNARTRRTKKDALAMPRPLNPPVTMHEGRYRFRCRMADGGRPWVCLSPGLTEA